MEEGKKKERTKKMTEWYLKSPEEVKGKLRVESSHGLSSEEATSRLQENGKNKLRATPKAGWLSKIIEPFKEPLILLLMVSAVVSLVLGEVEDAIGIFVAVSLVNAVGIWQEHKSSQAVEALTSLTARNCLVVRDGNVKEIPAEDLVVGDVVQLRVGVHVPADLRLIEANYMLVDESILTGECEAASKDVNLHYVEKGNVEQDIMELPKGISLSVAERRNMVYMGTLVVAGTGIGIVVEVGSDTELGKIAVEIDE